MFNLSSQQDKTAVTAQKVKEALDGKEDAVLLDVRTPEEYTEGHLKGSMLIPVQDLEQHLDKIPDKTKKYYVYCRRGIRGAKATEILKNAGYTNVHNMTGGIEAWISQKYPVEK